MEGQRLFQKRGVVFGGLVAASVILFVVVLNHGAAGGVVDVTLDREPGVSMTHEIIFGDEGYEPNTIIILAGDTVVFKNQRNHPFWPASNIHPNHTIYSTFDPREPIPKEESWEFQFDRVGTWNYHDHIRSYYQGTIIVEPADTP